MRAESANRLKIERIEDLGATVRLEGDDIEDARMLVAAVLEDRERFAGRRIATIICGSNVMSSDFERWTLAL